MPCPSGAGDVFYNVAKFNQKNRENLTADMKDLMASSSNELVVDVSCQCSVSEVSSPWYRSNRCHCVRGCVGYHGEFHGEEAVHGLFRQRPRCQGQSSSCLLVFSKPR